MFSLCVKDVVACGNRTSLPDNKANILEALNPPHRLRKVFILFCFTSYFDSVVTHYHYYLIVLMYVGPLVPCGTNQQRSINWTSAAEEQIKEALLLARYALHKYSAAEVVIQ